MALLFVSDVHLDAQAPEATRQFLEFLQTTASEGEALYILGDLFEAWVGDDDEAAVNQTVCAALRELSGRVPCFALHGNRDFLLGPGFTERSGCRLLPDPVIVQLPEEALLLTHGDALCTDDRAYQRLRATVRDPGWQRQFLALSIAARRLLAGAARAGSQAHTAALEYTVADVNSASVVAALRAAGTATLLHGHTHRPAIHPLTVDGRGCTRIVLGDWHSRGSLLRWDRGGPELVSLPR